MFESPKREAPSIGMTPLIDVVFILLIFVVLAANFDRIRGLKVDLPEASSQYKPQKRKALVVTITAKGVMQVGDDIVKPEQLEATFKRLRKKHDALLLRGDGKSNLKFTVKVLDAASNVGFTSVSLATRRTP
ncbi:MAG: biopolymer transporter ExbD [Deltaproteobacteria bacterium]|nr:MAG: biopolymer transporter ExbD [Deltaproteobacteria bacterium]